MFCNQCGSSLPAGVAYCTHCGKAVGTPPVALPPMAVALANSAQGRALRHRQILGVLWLVRAFMVMVPALFLLGISGMHRWPMRGGGIWMGPMGGPSFLGPLLGGLSVLFVGLFALDLATGLGLLMVQSWARILAIVAGIVELISFPFGTALGIYTLWVMLPNESEREYQQLVQSVQSHLR